jgi:HD-like signal output (HDOD) protein
MRRGWGLIVTAHCSVRLPELHETEVSLELAGSVVTELLKSSDDVNVSQQEIADRYARRQGNLREMLFDLYDLFEQRRKS